MVPGVLATKSTHLAGRYEMFWVCKKTAFYIAASVQQNVLRLWRIHRRCVRSSYRNNRTLPPYVIWIRFCAALETLNCWAVIRLTVMHKLTVVIIFYASIHCDRWCAVGRPSEFRLCACWHASIREGMLAITEILGNLNFLISVRIDLITSNGSYEK